MTKKKKKIDDPHDYPCGALVPYGGGGPGVDWEKVKKNSNKKTKKKS